MDFLDHLTVVDYAVALVVSASFIIAILRGFVVEFTGIMTWVGATAATVYGMPKLLPAVEKLIPKGLMADVVSGVLIFAK